MKRLGYLPQLDGIRGIAISFVVADHYFGLHEGGSTGVRLFFVLSGFLITTLLLEEHAETGSIDLGAFYVRRARRLFPALAMLLALYYGFQAGGADLRVLTERVVLAASYLSNFAVAFHFHDLLSGSALGPLWSLAQEEQFYAAWPVLLVVGIRSRRMLRYLLATLVGLLLYEQLLARTGASSSRIYYGPDTNAVWLIGGAGLAIIHRRQLNFPSWFGIVGVGCIGWYLGCANLGWHWLGGTLTTAILLASYAATIAASLGSAVTARLLSFRPLVWVGSISYSVYLWHIVAIAVGSSLGATVGLKPLEWRSGSVVIALAVGWVSCRFVERPFRAARALEPERLPVSPASAAVD